MHRDVLKDKWNQLGGDIRKKWGDLTNDDLARIQGDCEKFIGVLQEKYGYERERAEKELNDFLNRPAA